MTYYDKIIRELFRENAGLPLDPSRNSMPPDEPIGSNFEDEQGAFEDTLDADTNPEEYSIDGGNLKQEISRILSSFGEKMNRFAGTLEPDRLKELPLLSLKETVSKAASFVNSIQNNAKSKPGTGQDYKPATIVAREIAADSDKEAAFHDLHKELTDFISSVSEIEGKISSLQTKVSDFVRHLNNGKIESAQEGSIGDDGISAPEIESEF